MVCTRCGDEHCSERFNPENCPLGDIKEGKLTETQIRKVRNIFQGYEERHNECEAGATDAIEKILEALGVDYSFLYERAEDDYRIADEYDLREILDDVSPGIDVPVEGLKLEGFALAKGYVHCSYCDQWYNTIEHLHCYCQTRDIED